MGTIVCPRCLSNISADADRCKFCTSWQDKVNRVDARPPLEPGFLLWLARKAFDLVTFKRCRKKWAEKKEKTSGGDQEEGMNNTVRIELEAGGDEEAVPGS